MHVHGTVRNCRHPRSLFYGEPRIALCRSPDDRDSQALLDRGDVADNSDLTLETVAGLIPVAVRNGKITMCQPSPEFGEVANPALVAAVGGLKAEDIAHRPRFVSTGVPFCIAVLNDLETLRRVELDPTGYRAYAEAYTKGATDFRKPFWVALEGFCWKGVPQRGCRFYRTYRLRIFSRARPAGRWQRISGRRV